MCVGFLSTVVRGLLLSRLTRQSRKVILPFSSISLVNCMYVFCLLRCSRSKSISSLCTAVIVSST